MMILRLGQKEMLYARDCQVIADERVRFVTLFSYKPVILSKEFESKRQEEWPTGTGTAAVANKAGAPSWSAIGSCELMVNCDVLLCDKRKTFEHGGQRSKSQK